MVRILNILLFITFFSALALPPFRYFGAKESWPAAQLAGVEYSAKVPALTLDTYTNRQFQTAFTEDFSKNFFLRKTFLKTALQLHDWMNLGLFHYGYHCSILEGRDGVIFEKPYAKYHLEDVRGAGMEKYGRSLAAVKELDEFCRSVGADFIYLLMPDKSQVYEDYLPRWLGWLWDYSSYDIQSHMAELCRDRGIKAFNGCRFLNEQRKLHEEWLFPPGGTHVNALGNGLVVEALAKALNEGGRSSLRINPFLGVERSEEVWDVDDDIAKLLNIWDTGHVDSNVRYRPRYAQTNVTMNAGSAVLFGDCFRGQISHTFWESGLFAKKKVLAERRKGQCAEDFRDVIGDLKLVVMVYQSFNSGRLDGRYEEITAVLNALREARARWERKCDIIPETISGKKAKR